MPVPRAVAAFLTLAAATAALTSCATGPSSKTELCDQFDELGTRITQADGLFDNVVFHSADDLGDLAERYPDSDVASEATSLHEIADADSTSGGELMEATEQIANTCGHGLGMGGLDDGGRS